MELSLFEIMKIIVMYAFSIALYVNLKCIRAEQYYSTIKKI